MLFILFLEAYDITSYYFILLARTAYYLTTCASRIIYIESPFVVSELKFIVSGSYGMLKTEYISAFAFTSDVITASDISFISYCVKPGFEFGDTPDVFVDKTFADYTSLLDEPPIIVFVW